MCTLNIYIYTYHILLIFLCYFYLSCYKNNTKYLMNFFLNILPIKNKIFNIFYSFHLEIYKNNNNKILNYARKKYLKLRKELKKETWMGG